jgi:hypothetical protein
VANGQSGITSFSNCCTLFGLALQALKRTSGDGGDREWGKLDAVGAIILAAASAEGFINELTELARQYVNDTPTFPPEFEALATQVLAEENRHAKTVDKFLVAIEALSDERPDKGSCLHQNFALLMAARDGLIHTKLDVQPSSKGGLNSSLPAVVKRLRSKNVIADGYREDQRPLSAIDQLSTRAVARWACSSAADIVQEVITKVPPPPDPGMTSILVDFSRSFTMPPQSASR